MARPPLPFHCANSNIKHILASGNLPPVKYQILSCQGQDILVGRLKIETSTGSGHAFILRRYDTGAVSLTTMFRAAFPKADEQSEKDEVQWVKETFDLTGNNGSSKDTSITRLAGTWVGPELARELGEAYLLGNLISLVVDAHPDPTGNYRRSGKGGTSTPKPPSAADTGNPAVTSPSAGPNPPKRRKEFSPVPIRPVSPPAEKKAVPRRSNRTKSPSLKAAAPPSLAKTPSRKSIRREPKQEVSTPGGSDETAFDEDAEAVEDVAGEQLRKQDIEEQKILIEGLKVKRDAAMKISEMDHDGSQNLVAKRSREAEEEALGFNFKEPEVGERAIATNRRITGYFEEPRRKSLAWGVAAFAFGVGAVTFLPNFL